MNTIDTYGNPYTTLPTAMPATVSKQKHLVTQVSKSQDPGQHRVRQTMYVVTTYTKNGIKQSTMSSHTINYIV